ncbi:MAG: arylsulfotransferase family protein [Candidatus Dormibacteria bacterium]
MIHRALVPPLVLPVLVLSACGVQGRAARAGGTGLPTAAACAAVSVYPSPGARTASTTTQVSFRNVDPVALEAQGVTVTGSRTGRHTGHWVTDSDNDGVSFYPSRHFAAGEEVTVRTGSRICGSAGSTLNFRTAVPPAQSPQTAPPPPRAKTSPDQPTVGYASLPGVQVPKLRVAVPADLGQQYLFESPQGGTMLGGPMILNGQGQAVWFSPLPPTVVAADLKVQRYQGRPALTYWQGKIISGHGVGEDVIVNSSYQVVKEVEPGNGYSADLHEFLLSSSGTTAWLTTYDTVGWDLKPVGGPARGAVLDSIVQEVDLATGNVLFEWHRLDHVALRLTNQSYSQGPAFDYFHVNSIDPQSSGLVLISSRNTSTLYAVSEPTGQVLWRLGGKASSFAMAKETSFALQHDVELHGGDAVSVFDDEDSPDHGKPARGIVLNVDFQKRTVSLESSYSHGGLLVSSQGNLQLLPSGRAVVGWGAGHATSEYTKSGAVLFDAAFGTSISSYRAYLYPWVGTPATPPSLAVVHTASGALAVDASWNGSTQTRIWQVWGGPDAQHLQLLATAARAGFQTQVAVGSAPAVVQVVALSARGQELGRSQPASTTTG